VAQEPRTAQERALDLLRATLATTSLLPDTPAKRLVWAIRCAIVLGVLVLIASAVDKTLWNWLDLLIIPVVLAIGGYWFNRQQQSREFAIAERRTQDEALQAYLNHMTELLLDHCLRTSKKGDGVRTVAWARTKTALRRLDDGAHKGRVLRFLYEAGLLNEAAPVIDLKGADLREADLRGSVLPKVCLKGADLRGANLRGAVLDMAYLSGVNLLPHNKENPEQWNRHNLKNVDWGEEDFRASGLTIADLSNASLIGARLCVACLGRANLRNADLRDADLRDADLRDADLRGANITQDQLKQVVSIEGAIMPDGSKHP
jgi:uncharacterized protein YjbI with pentapeptide repeats